MVPAAPIVPQEVIRVVKAVALARVAESPSESLPQEVPLKSKATLGPLSSGKNSDSDVKMKQLRVRLQRIRIPGLQAAPATVKTSDVETAKNQSAVRDGGQFKANQYLIGARQVGQNLQRKQTLERELEPLQDESCLRQHEDLPKWIKMPMRAYRATKVRNCCL